MHYDLIGLFNRTIPILIPSVGIVTGYGLDGPGSIPYSAKFSHLHNVQTNSGAHSASYPMGTRDSSLGVKWQGREADHSPPSSAKVMKGGAIPQLPHMSSWHSA
jgi:hypothetical protein